MWTLHLFLEFSRIFQKLVPHICGQWDGLSRQVLLQFLYTWVYSVKCTCTCTSIVIWPLLWSATSTIFSKTRVGFCTARQATSPRDWNIGEKYRSNINFPHLQCQTICLSKYMYYYSTECYSSTSLRPGNAIFKWASGLKIQQIKQCY